MKYLGGLEIGIRFRNDHDVKEFLSNKKYWGKWFCALKPGNSYIDMPERFAWLNIVGLPLHMWSEGNFARIAGTVGKLISPKMIPMSLQDVSCGNICVLTERKTKINKEVVVDSNKKILRVGIVEVNFAWSPFPSGPGINNECDGKTRTPNMANSDGMADQESEEDEDGISETVVSPACDPTDRGLSSEELEEGEFRYDCNIGDGKEAAPERMSVDSEASPGSGSPESDAGQPNCASEAGETQPSPIINCQRVDWNSEPNVADSTIVNILEVNVINNFGIYSELVKSGSFGLFKSGLVKNDGRKLPKSFGPINDKLNEPDSDVEFLTGLLEKRRDVPPFLD